ncbi:MAG TPA: malto-oligosyltrehalose synthase [Candidatus Binatia bacterium]|nr:malto-oligosyltrehalose synthase [Candidatus Binatia bacterium]
MLLHRVRAELDRPARRATYRLQLGPHLGFEGVAAAASYLEELGISHAYLSPCFRASPGSTHGYDVTDHGAFNPELGSAGTFDRMAATLSGLGLGLVLDVVPNHMGIAGDTNPWWMDVLENGQSSPYAGFFDIDWAPVKPELRDRVLLPVLADQYGRVLESQQLVLDLVEGAFVIRYAGARLPVAPETYRIVLGHGQAALSDRLGPDDPHMLEFLSIGTAIEHLPARTVADPVLRAERLREKEVIKRRLAALVKESGDIRGAIEDTIRVFNGVAGEPRSFDRLDALITAQVYRLADWRVAADEVNYRRFFDVNHLAAIRVEARPVFEAAHRLVLPLVASGAVTGLRIDHPDGLYGPGEYFRRLQDEILRLTAARLVPDLDEAGTAALLTALREATAAAGDGPPPHPCWILAEKILQVGEELPDWWAVAGTTGYDFLASVNGLFVDRGTSREMTAIYHRFTGLRSGMGDVVNDTKRLIMETTMASEIQALALELDRISETNRLSRDFTLTSLARAIREVMASFPVYRTYVGDRGLEVERRDRAYIERAVAEARRRNPQLSASIFDFVRDTLLLRPPEGAPESELRARREFVMRFQQTTGPVTAKGVEDTAFYRYHRLVSLNEVGSDPARFGEAPSAFHARNAERLRRWPQSLLATATHDTKRGEDVRARIDVLSEIPRQWQEAVRRWHLLTRRLRREVDGRAAPDRNDEYLLYQTAVGAWPLDEAEVSGGAFAERVAAYMEKATREAKVQTGWINPDARYDEAVRSFVTGVLAPGSVTATEIGRFALRLAGHGLINSLGQTVLKIAAPGIPDFYQGTELWDLSLVDPDNRRPVDLAERRRRLAELIRRGADPGADDGARCDEMLANWTDGRIKLHVIHRALGIRRLDPPLFTGGAYRAVGAVGSRADHVVAFARGGAAGRVVLAVTTRLSARLAGFGGPVPRGDEVWDDTRLALEDADLGGVYHDVFTGRRATTAGDGRAPGIPVGRVLAHLPVALLVREATPR